MNNAHGTPFQKRETGGVYANKKWVNRISNTVILFFVYSAFCNSVKERIWHQYGLLLTVQILLCVAALFGTVSLLIYLAAHLARLKREDAIACYFCSVKKTLAMGVPLVHRLLNPLGFRRRCTKSALCYLTGRKLNLFVGAGDEGGYFQNLVVETAERAPVANADYRGAP